MSTREDDGGRFAVPRELLDRLRADPGRAPEHLALAAADIHGPAAQRWASSNSGEQPDELARMAKRRHASLSRYGGAITGLGGWMTILPDLAGLAWVQSRMVFFIAAAHGHDPTDPMRPAELLVLQELYDDPRDAREALDGTGRRVATALVTRRLTGRRGKDRAKTRRMAQMAGKRMGTRLGGRMIPGVAALFNAVVNERDTRALADRAMDFYRP
ncbi:MAG TPA: EcsC family protein [Solirubrobacteraceae bacterium]|nr:EcsC family protein [Solirubrobacteraceae bacterium]